MLVPSWRSLSRCTCLLAVLLTSENSSLTAHGAVRLLALSELIRFLYIPIGSLHISKRSGLSRKLNLDPHQRRERSPGSHSRDPLIVQPLPGLESRHAHSPVSALRTNEV